jgi:hypothetical protein
MNEITNEHIKQLAAEAQSTTALLTLFTSGMRQNENEEVSLVPYYLKWIDVTNIALANMSETIDQDTKKKLADDLIALMTIPLNGMMRAIIQHANNKSINLPPMPQPLPAGVFEYKKWAVDYIKQSLAAIKEHIK